MSLSVEARADLSALVNRIVPELKRVERLSKDVELPAEVKAALDRLAEAHLLVVLTVARAEKR